MTRSSTDALVAEEVCSRQLYTYNALSLIKRVHKCENTFNPHMEAIDCLIWSFLSFLVPTVYCVSLVVIAFAGSGALDDFDTSNFPTTSKAVYNEETVECLIL